jgi:hypothetical protein
MGIFDRPAFGLWQRPDLCQRAYSERMEEREPGIRRGDKQELGGQPGFAFTLTPDLYTTAVRIPLERHSQATIHPSVKFAQRCVLTRANCPDLEVLVRHARQDRDCREASRLSIPGPVPGKPGPQITVAGRPKLCQELPCVLEGEHHRARADEDRLAIVRQDLENKFRTVQHGDCECSTVRTEFCDTILRCFGAGDYDVNFVHRPILIREIGKITKRVPTIAARYRLAAQTSAD